MKKGLSNQSSTPHQDVGLPRSKILRGRKNFQQLFEQESVTLRNRYVQLRFRIYLDSEKGCRMGFIVKKKLGKAAKRNRVRRLVREAYRLNQHRSTGPVQSAGIGFHGALMANTIELNFDQAQQSVTDLLDRAHSYIHSITDPDL